MTEPITYVGVDAHADTLQIAVLWPHRPAEHWSVPHEERTIARVRRRLISDAPGPVECCYEAGVCGYTLQRRLSTAGLRCHVIAPALVPQSPGDRVKTDRRDAHKLATLLRAGLLTPVHPPTPEAESVRDLCRARDDARSDLHRSRQRLIKFLLRRGLRYPGRHWTKRHRAWLDTLRWSPVAERQVVAEYRLAIAQLEARLVAIDQTLGELAESDPYRGPVGALRCFRGIDVVTAVMLLAELHDFRRFPSPRALMAFVGLVPSERSSGPRHVRGPITKMGNGAARRLLIEAAWHYQHEPHIGVALRNRRVGQPAPVLAIADQAQTRLCRRYRAMRARLKPTPVVTVAIARELVGFIWAALQLTPALTAA